MPDLYNFDSQIEKSQGLYYSMDQNVKQIQIMNMQKVHSLNAATKVKTRQLELIQHIKH